MHKEHSYIAPRNVAALQITADQAAEVLGSVALLGVAIDADDINVMAKGMGMDALQSPAMTPAGVPIQFLQHILPGIVYQATMPMLIDELVGITVAGDWADEEIITQKMELTGRALPYGDHTDIPLSSWTMGYEKRNVVRFEEGLQVGELERARAAKAGINTEQEKRSAAVMALNIQRNQVGFYGYNTANIKCYGFMNEPGLPAYVTVATGAAAGSPTEWADKTFQEITADIREAFAALRSRSGTLVDPEKTPTTLAIASDAIDYLSVTGPEGLKSVRAWIKETYPSCRIVAVPQFNAADGGENVFYLYAESVPGTGTDDGRVFNQIVPAAVKLLGSHQGAKAYTEDHTNATAGVTLKRPYAIVRRSGI